MKKILVIRFSSIGDIVLTTPVIRCLKEQLPDIQLHALTKKKFSSLYDTNPHIDKVYEFDDSLSDIIKELKKEKYDYVIDLQKNNRSLRVCMALSCKYRSFPKLNFKKFLLTSFKINLLPNIHIVDRYFMAVKDLCVHNDNKGLDFFISDSNFMQEPDIPESFRNGFYAIVIGGTYFTKILPSEKIIEIIKRLDEPVVLLGGTGDMKRADEIVKATNNLVVGNPVGKLNIEQSASVLLMAKKVLTNDTGMMHIAAALHKTVISVWGNTVPEFGMYPYLPLEPEKVKIIECKDVKCRPCSKLGYKKCPRKHFNCMMNIDIDYIVQKLKE